MGLLLNVCDIAVTRSRRLTSGVAIASVTRLAVPMRRAVDDREAGLEQPESPSTAAYLAVDAGITLTGPRWPGFCALSDIRRRLAERPFLRNVSIMLSGAAAGQMVSILLSPVLTRLYSPQQFGVLSVYSALLAILVVVASLRYELTIPM